MDYMKVGTDVVVGGVAGVVDEVVQNQDDKREDDRHKLATGAPGALAVGKKLPIFSRIGTYYNYGVPILSILGIAAGFLKGDMATRLLTASGQLTGREVTHTMTTKARPIPPATWNVWERVPPRGNQNEPPRLPVGSVLEF